MARVIPATQAELAPGVVALSDRRKGVVPATDRLKGYVPGSEPEGAVTVSPDTGDVEQFRRYLRDYVELKTEEIDEGREAWRYYHGKQRSAEKLAQMADEGRPDITYNRIALKVNGIVGLLERLRQDPKAYPRTPAHEAGADVATQCLRYALDAAHWESELSEVNLDLTVRGIGGWQMELEPTDDGSQDPLPQRVPTDTFFYDPRSLRADFSDAHYLGVAKWMRKAEAIAFLPQARDAIEESASAFASGDWGEEIDSETSHLWWDGKLKKLRVVEVWYREGDAWRWAIYTGMQILAEGDSPFVDGRGKSVSRFVMQSANVDERGIRYGFVRNLFGPQDEINDRHSKALHAYMTKQIVVEEGVVTDIEAIRAEAHRVDGVISLPQGQSGKISINSNTDTALANVQLLQDARNEIEQSGPNTALIGQGLDNKSGRAIALIQQAAIAALGPFIVRVRAMKLRLYDVTWAAIQQEWTTPRYIRLTDDEGVAGFLGINQPRVDEYGFPAGVENPIGKVMVDFVLDEGPDTVTMREDAQAALSQAMAAAGSAAPPMVMVQMSRALVETMNLPPSSKKRILAAYDQMEQQAMQPPAPEVQAAAQLELRKKAADATDKEASAVLKMEQAKEKNAQTAMNQLSAEIAAIGGASLVPNAPRF